MADGREVHIWSNHAVEQWEENKTGHVVSDDYVLRKFMLENVKKGAKVLDFGCGGGLWFHMFRGFDYKGTDQNENMIRHAKMRFPEDTDRFEVNPWDKLPYEDASFDAVYTSAVLQHNLHPQKDLAVAEIARILKPGGFYIGTEDTLREDNYHWAFPSRPPYNEDLDNGYSFTPKGWREYMSKFGLSLKQYTPPSEYVFIKD